MIKIIASAVIVLMLLFLSIPVLPVVISIGVVYLIITHHTASKEKKAMEDYNRRSLSVGAGICRNDYKQYGPSGETI